MTAVDPTLLRTLVDAPVDDLLALAAAVVAFVMGAACGLANGLITTVGRIEPFIATLGTMGIFRALITYLTDGGTWLMWIAAAVTLWTGAEYLLAARKALPHEA